MRHRPTTSTRPRQVWVERHTNRPPPGSPFPDQVRIAGLECSDSEALLAMLARCSPTTLYRRFHGVTDGVSYARRVLLGSPDRDSFAAWRGDRCVGLGNLHVRDDTAEIGVLVEDGWQGRGVGTALLVALAGRARERRSPFLRADLLAENHFALRALAGVGPMRTKLAQGTYTAVIDLGLGTALAGTPFLTTPREIRPIQSVREAVGAVTAPSGLEDLR